MLHGSTRALRATFTNCQIGVFTAYVSRHGHAFIDRALYLPKEWTDDPDRLEAAYVPADVGFATKPKLATRMIAGAIAASVPFEWVAGDTISTVSAASNNSSGRQRLRAWGQQRSCVSILGKRVPVAGTAADIAQTRRASDWKRLSAGAEPKDRGCTIGVISNWPISMPKNSTAQIKVCGRAVC